MLLDVLIAAGALFVLGPIVGVVAWNLGGQLRYRLRNGRWEAIGSTPSMSGDHDSGPAGPASRGEMVAFWSLVAGLLFIAIFVRIDIGWR